MARIRTYKPEIHSDRITGKLDDFEWRLFLGIKSFADDVGVFEADYSELRAKIFPYRPRSLEKKIELALKGRLKELIFAFTFKEKQYGWVKNFKKHEVITHEGKLHIEKDQFRKILESSGKFRKVPENTGKIWEPSGLTGSTLPLEEKNCPLEEKEKENLPDPLKKKKEKLPPVEKKLPPPVCAEPQADSPPPTAILEFPTARFGEVWILTAEKLKEYQDVYTHLDALFIFRKARQWCVDNPTQRKTARGMPAFLGKWIARETNKGGASKNGGQNAGKTENRVTAEPGKYDAFS